MGFLLRSPGLVLARWLPIRLTSTATALPVRSAPPADETPGVNVVYKQNTFGLDRLY